MIKKYNNSAIMLVVLLTISFVYASGVSCLGLVDEPCIPNGGCTVYDEGFPQYGIIANPSTVQKCHETQPGVVGTCTNKLTACTFTCQTVDKGFKVEIRANTDFFLSADGQCN